MSERVQLVSEFYKSDESASRAHCVSFAYHMWDANATRPLGPLSLYTRVGTLGPRLEWTRKGSQGRSWQRGQFTARIWEEARDFVIIVEAAYSGESRPNNAGYIGLDDVKVTPGFCHETLDADALGRVRATLPKSCSFEVGMCGWSHDPSGEFNWTLSSAQTRLADLGGLLTDHTLGSLAGHFMYASTVRARGEQEAARLLSTPFKTVQGVSLEFWYHMYGSSVSMLNVWLERLQTSGNTLELLWTRSRQQGPGWRHAHVYARISGAYRFVFETLGSRGYIGESGDVAIDDIHVANGNKPLHNACDFEDEEACGFVNERNASVATFDWRREQAARQVEVGLSGSGPRQDHTTQSDLGHFMIARWPQSPAKQSEGI